MLESARKGYWKATPEQLQTTLKLHTDITRESGAACTDFVCNNQPLQQFIAGHLPEHLAREYNDNMAGVKGIDTPYSLVAAQQADTPSSGSAAGWLIALLVLAAVATATVVLVIRRKRGSLP